MEKMKYIGKEARLPFGTERECTLLFPKGPKGPATLVTENLEGAEITFEYDSRKAMLGDWLPV